MMDEVGKYDDKMAVFSILAIGIPIFFCNFV